MAVSNRIITEGVADTLKQLNKVAPDIVKAISKELKTSAQPVIADAKGLLPTPTALTNWGSWITSGKDGRTPGRDLSYDAAKAKRGIKSAANRTPDKDLKSLYGGRRYKVIPLLELRQTDPAGAIYERAGYKTDSAFNRSLNRKRGAVSIDLGTTLSGRALYPAFFRRESAIIKNVIVTIRRIETEANRRLAA